MHITLPVKLTTEKPFSPEPYPHAINEKKKNQTLN